MIEFESVGKTFRDGTAAVVDLSLTVPSDKITVIVGPSGCGKTTTLRMINRMLEPSSGKILWDGAPLKSKRKTTLRRQMGYVIQSGGLFPHRTVIDNVGTVPGLLGWDKTKTRKRAIELLDAVGLDRKLANRFPAQLSGGQQQRVGVARALAADPLVLLMDEPFSAVDPVVRAELHEFFLGLQRELSKTIVLITHDIDEAIKLGDQVAILRVGGKLAQVGTPQELLDEPADAFVEGFVGKDRGYRALSFVNAGNLSLGRVKVVRDPASARSGEPTLVVDGEARPLGWADTEHPGQLYGLGATFDPEHDNLRSALDSALTSPFGLAVAVTRETGRYAGVVTAADILAQVTQSRAAVAETLSVREAETAVSGSAPDQADPSPADAERSTHADESDTSLAKADETLIRAGAVTTGGVAAGGVAAGAVAPDTDETAATDAEQQDASESGDDTAGPTEGTDEPATDVQSTELRGQEDQALEDDDHAPVDDQPTDDVPADEVSVDDVPVEDVPADDLPVEDLPVDDLPADELAVDDLPIDDPALADLPDVTPDHPGEKAS